MSEPQYIGRYRIVRPLGEGGMGRVLLAEVAGAGGFARRVVLKLVRDELDEALKQSLLDEARVTATLVHRNIVPVLDLHESGAQRLVVLEHIDGMDVRQLLKRTPLLDWPLAAFIGGEVAAALDYAHRRQIIHRDVSPANILVSWEGEVKLSDFGVAKVVGGPGRGIGPTQGLKGKLGYMAPEQMKAQAIDARADVYALGVVLYEMLTGKNPMRGGPVVPPPLPSTVPGELAAIVMRAVERNREDRFSSAADVREAILHVPGQPADPARQLADFLGELKNEQAPSWSYPPDRQHIIYFETTVIFSEGLEDSPLIINNFETDVPNTAHVVDDLSKIVFAAFKLKATNAPVLSQVNCLIYSFTPGPDLTFPVHPSGRLRHRGIRERHPQRRRHANYEAGATD